MGWVGLHSREGSENEEARMSRTVGIWEKRKWKAGGAVGSRPKVKYTTARAQGHEAAML